MVRQAIHFFFQLLLKLFKKVFPRISTKVDFLHYQRSTGSLVLRHGKSQKAQFSYAVCTVSFILKGQRICIQARYLVFNRILLSYRCTFAIKNWQESFVKECSSAGIDNFLALWIT